MEETYWPDQCDQCLIRQQQAQTIYVITRHLKEQGLLIEGRYWGSPADEEQYKISTLTRGDGLYLLEQHRAILHTVLLWHIQGRPQDAKVST